MQASPDSLSIPPLALDADVLQRLNQQGPRYTSYPSADRFSPQFSEAHYRAAVARAQGTPERRPLSLYIHIPYCESLCYYCACNKVITREHDKAVEYLRYLKLEIERQVKLLPPEARVEQLHFGGGTPTYLSDAQMGELIAFLRAHFNFASEDEGEYSIEIDPRTVDRERILSLRRQGFNRISLGVQDFNAEVQKAVNRIQPEAMTLAAIRAAREAGFHSLSVDLIYGLPQQSLATMHETLDKVIAADPDRISIYSYAHMPQLFKAQTLIVDADLPAPEVKLQMLALCINRLTEAGYVYIGMDHFAKPGDDLARALGEGRLQRNFQGYSTHAECDMLAFGVSAISSLGGAYSQNEKSVAKYYERLDQGGLPVIRGMQLNADDLLRRDVIQALICHFVLDKRAIEATHGIVFDDYFAKELARLEEFEAAGLLVREADGITVTPLGRLVIRNICMVFDRYLGLPRDTALQRVPFSRTI